MRYSVRGVCDESATRAFIEWCLECYSTHDIGPWALADKNNNNLIGFCGISPEKVGDTEEINLGYKLAKHTWNQGLATEATKSVIKYAFDNKNLKSLVVIIEPEHVASLKVAEKDGFQKFDMINFHNRSVRLYRITFEE